MINGVGMATAICTAVAIASENTSATYRWRERLARYVHIAIEPHHTGHLNGDRWRVDHNGFIIHVHRLGTLFYQQEDRPSHRKHTKWFEGHIEQ